MINYTERITQLMRDMVARVPTLGFIDMSEVLVFARFGRSDADGPFASCHCLNLPTSEPGYYYWRNRRTGEMTRRSEWFVTKSPEVWFRSRRIAYLISFALPRFSDQTLDRSGKEVYYPGGPPWIGKLDTVLHELYHIDPEQQGIRRVPRADGSRSFRSHGPEFYTQVSQMVQAYLASRPDPAVYDFLRYDFAELNAVFGGVVATTFRNFPSFPQRYQESLATQPRGPGVKVEPFKPASQPARYSELDLHIRQFVAVRARDAGAAGHGKCVQRLSARNLQAAVPPKGSLGAPEYALPPASRPLTRRTARR